MRRLSRCGFPCISGARAGAQGARLRHAMQSVLDAHLDQIEMATTAADIERIVSSGEISVFLTIEGGHKTDDDLRVLLITTG